MTSKADVVKISGMAFDLEGTLVDLEPYHYMAHICTAAHFGLSFELEEIFTKFPHFIGGPNHAVAAEIINSCSSNVPVDEFVTLRKQQFNALIGGVGVIQARDGALEFIEWIRHLGFPICIGSITERPLAEKILNESGLHMLFDGNYVFREDVSAPKPSGEVYQKTAAIMGISTCEQLVFEDSVSGLKAANAAGSIPIAFPTTRHSEYTKAILSEAPLGVFDNWEDVTVRKTISDLIR